MNRAKLTSFKVQSSKLKVKAFSFILILFLALPLALAHSQELPYTVKRITDGNSTDYNPEFSPDGKRIVFVSKTDNTEKTKKGEFWHKTPYSLNLWLIDSDGNNRRQLTSGDIQDFAPKFTPDGKKVVFVSTRRDGKWDIWSIDIDGSNLKMISDTQKETFWEKLHHPIPTPDGSGLIFIIYRNEPVSVWFMDIENKSLRRITSGGSGDGDPMIFPDGKQIAFKSTRQGMGDIWSIDISGKNYSRLTFGDYPEFYPTVSPDGRKISYITKKEGMFDVWVMDRDGRNKKKLTKYLPKGAWGMGVNHDDRIDIGYYNIAWHPDGTKFALTTWDSDKKESYLTMLSFEKDIGSVIEELPEEKEVLPEYTLIGEKELTGGGNWDDFGPSFSPEGKTIAFASNRKGNWDIWSIGADGEGLKQVTEDITDELAPVFSPDGKEIAFIRQSSTLNQVQGSLQYDIWLMNSDGSGARQVTKDSKVISYPAWNPNGKEIAFVAKGDKCPEIQLIPLNKGGQGVVTVSRVISNWDTDKPNPAVFPFTKEEIGEGIIKMEIERKKKEFNPNLRNVGARSIFSQGETILPPLPPYPLKEFLYRIDYNSAGDGLIFESNQAENIDIWSVKRDGTGLTRITKGNGPHLNPVFSPDNKKIAYARRKIESSSYNELNYNIWITDSQTGEDMPINGEEQTDWNPVFSPDGKKIAYVTNRSGEFKHFSLWLFYLK